MPHLFLLFVLLPIAELWLIFQVGGSIGVLPTLLLILTTAAAGSWLLRQQGLSVLWRAKNRATQGQIPLEELGEGLLLAIAGAFLLTPGFLTDGVGFSLLFPVVRRWWLQRVRSIWGQSAGQGPSSDSYTSSGIIEGEFRRED